MDGFKTLPKMQHFKEGGSAKAEMCWGGSTSKKMKTGGKADKDDMKQDKAMIKKAFKQHDEAEHDKEPTEIKLRAGGRSKKKDGSVRKFKVGGTVDNDYGAKKSSGDLDNIKKTKDIKPGKAESESAAEKRPNLKGSDVEKEKSKPAGDKDSIKKVPPTGDKKADVPSGAKEMPNKYKTGRAVKKFADGRSTNTAAKYKYVDNFPEEAAALRNVFEKQAKEKAENRASMEKESQENSTARANKGKTFKENMAAGRVDEMGNAYKRGGKAKKMNTGGTAC